MKRTESVPKQIFLNFIPDSGLLRALLLCSVILLSGCTNSRNLRNLASSGLPNTNHNAVNNVITGFASFTISQITVGEPATTSSGSGGTSSGGTSIPTSTTTSTATRPVLISFDTSNSNISLLTYCTNASGGSPCQCKFTWTEANPNTIPPTGVSREVLTDVTSVEPYFAQCSTPSVWDSEIPNNTTVTIEVVPASGNSTQFKTNAYAYQKGDTPSIWDFTDSNGHAFTNIVRYSCYEQRSRGMNIVNRPGRGTVSNVGDFSFLVADKFCLRTFKGDVKGGSGCDDSAVPPADYTAQSYYFNMYIPDTEEGDINPGNQRFVCPTVDSGLTTGNNGRYWPLDATFALSQIKTQDFTVGVVANSRTTNSNDPTAKNSQCDGTTSDPKSANTMLYSCLGFAAKPNPDGTCPVLTQSDGVTPLYTYRLRRFVALYPTRWDTDGNILAGEPQSIDTIYVLDRPVNGPGSTQATMLGPKPCPFAFYDAKGVTGSNAYIGVNNSAWDGTNVDGTQFPNTDNYTAGTCSAMFPLTNSAKDKVSLTTLLSSQKLYVRPMHSWFVHYEEDTGFQACAPMANPFRDPPLHFAMNKSNVSWCAEAYPNKNYDTTINNPPLHTGASARTVIQPSTGISWTKFPLLAPETDVDNALEGVKTDGTYTNDTSYECTITYDGQDASSTKVGSQVPSQGCCYNQEPSLSYGATGASPAHLEPGTPCSAPNY